MSAAIARIRTGNARVHLFARCVRSRYSAAWCSTGIWAALSTASASADGRGGFETRPYADQPGFCKSATLDEVRKHGHVLTPGRYVGAAAQEDDGEPFEEKMRRLTATLREQQAEAGRLDAAIEANLQGLGYGQ